MSHCSHAMIPSDEDAWRPASDTGLAATRRSPWFHHGRLAQTHRLPVQSPRWIDTHQEEDRAQEAPSLAKWQSEREPQRQPGVAC